MEGRRSSSWSLFVLVEKHSGRARGQAINPFYGRDNLLETRLALSSRGPPCTRDMYRVHRVVIKYTRGLETQTPLYRSAARNRDENSGWACHRRGQTADRTICSIRWILRASYLTTMENSPLRKTTTLSYIFSGVSRSTFLKQKVWIYYCTESKETKWIVN